jgi:polar amino acid transport system substrate-binding protein
MTPLVHRVLVLGILAATACSPAGEAAQPTDVDAPRAELRTVSDGLLTVAADVPYPPFAYQDLTGFDLELARAIAARLGLRPRTEDVPFFNLFERLAASEFDIAVAATSITPELEAVINFSEPYFQVRQALVVDPMFRPTIAGTGDLGPGDSVAVVDGSTGQAWAREHLDPAGIDLPTYPDESSATEGLAAGVVDALLVDEVSALALTSSRPEFTVVETIPTGEGMGIAVDPGNPDLLDAVNEALDAIVADGTYDLIFDRYAGSLPPGGRITAPAEPVEVPG